MKITIVSATLFVFLALSSFSQTNSVPLPGATNSVPVIGPLAPVLDLLPSGTAAVLMKAIVWFGSFSLVLAPFSVWIQFKLTDMLNTVAASKEADDDVWLTGLFRNPAYRFAATALRFLHVRLPTISDLERALALQAEAGVSKPK